jgi:hypothetical protein
MALQGGMGKVMPDEAPPSPVDNKTSRPPINNAWEAIIELVRQNGLVTLALLVLVWAVWFQATMNSEQNAAWRTTLTGVTAELTAMREARTVAWKEQAAAEGRVDEVLRMIQTLLASVEESCLKSKP